MTEHQERPRPRGGLYRVQHGSICAGFVIRAGIVAECAPILRKRIAWWIQRAERIDVVAP